jgi:hypothetical protein
MKITFIYDYKSNETWSTPLSLLNEFKERGWETEIVPIPNGDDSALQLWIQQDTPTDIVLFMDWGRFDSKWLDKSLKPNSFWIQESGDDPQNFERNYPKANRFHYTITPDKVSAEEYRICGINADWVPHWADTAVQFPMSLPGSCARYCCCKHCSLLPINTTAQLNGVITCLVPISRSSLSMALFKSP